MYGKKFQKGFVKELCNNVRDEILKQINQNKIPQGWDGIELRWLIKEKFDQCVLGGFTDKRCKRFKEFENECLISNLY